jgi:hypothetical protein
VLLLRSFGAKMDASSVYVALSRVADNASMRVVALTAEDTAKLLSLKHSTAQRIWHGSYTNGRFDAGKARTRLTELQRHAGRRAAPATVRVAAAAAAARRRDNATDNRVATRDHTNTLLTTTNHLAAAQPPRATQLTTTGRPVTLAPPRSAAQVEAEYLAARSELTASWAWVPLIAATVNVQHEFVPLLRRDLGEATFTAAVAAYAADFAHRGITADNVPWSTHPGQPLVRERAYIKPNHQERLLYPPTAVVGGESTVALDFYEELEYRIWRVRAGEPLPE